MKSAAAAGLCLLLVGCAEDGRAPVPVTQVDLRAAITNRDLTPVGVTVAPDGQRYVFDESLGLYRIDGATATALMHIDELPDPGPTAAVRLPITDIAALGNDQFALTAVGDGYLLDLAAHTLTQHFCYVPSGPGDGGTPVSTIQRTDSLAYDAATDRLYVQAITYDPAYVFQYGQIAGYDRTSGTDVAWYSLVGDIVATAMIVPPSGDLVIGTESKLMRLDGPTGLLTQVDDLYDAGVRSIDGLAIDEAAHTLVVVDKVSDAMFDIDLDAVKL